MQKNIMKKINLHINYFECNLKERDDEILDSLNKNLQLNIFNKIFIYIEDLKFKNKLNSFDNDKIKILYCGERPTFQTIFNLSNFLTSDNDINVLANSDIIFDETIKLVQNIQSNFFYCLTRYEDNKLFWIKNEDDLFSLRFTYSQDAWVWTGKSKFIESNFYMGQPGCDNKLAYDAAHLRYILINPCFDIKIHHNHKSNVRLGLSNEKNYRTEKHLKPCLLIEPSHINEIKDIGLISDDGWCHLSKQI